MKKMKAILILLVCVNLVQAEVENLYFVTIQAAANKPNGKPWDVSGGSPDIILSVEGKVYWNVGCRDTYRCQVRFISPKDNWYFEIYDKDLVNNDLIGKGRCSVGQKCKLGQATISIINQAAQAKKANGNL